MEKVEPQETMESTGMSADHSCPSGSKSHHKPSRSAELDHSCLRAQPPRIGDRGPGGPFQPWKQTKELLEHWTKDDTPHYHDMKDPKTPAPKRGPTHEDLTENCT